MNEKIFLLIIFTIFLILGLILNVKSVSKSLSNIINIIIVICYLFIVILTQQDQKPYNYICLSLLGFGLGWNIRDYPKRKKKE